MANCPYRLCHRCGTGVIYGRYDEECISCLARKWMGIGHTPRSHLSLVLDPDDRDTLAEETSGEREG